MKTLIVPSLETSRKIPDDILEFIDRDHLDEILVFWMDARIHCIIRQIHNLLPGVRPKKSSITTTRICDIEISYSIAFASS